MRVSPWLVGLLLVACAPVPDEPVTDARPPAAATPIAPATGPVTTVPDDELAWRWVTRPDDAEFPQARDVHLADNIRYRFLVDEEREHAIVVREGSKGREDWRRELPQEFHPAGFMVHGEGRLYVALHSHISSGARVFALDDATGGVQWTTRVHGLGPISHSKYRNRVQLELRPEGLVVYGLESQGRYVESIDPTTGATTGNLQVPDAVATIPWQFDAPDPDRMPGDPTTATTDAGALHFVATYSPIASGASLHAERDGTIVWRTALEGLGTIAHSVYANSVEVRMLDDLVVTFGRESAGRYIEARDPETGALRSSQVFLATVRKTRR